MNEQDWTTENCPDFREESVYRTGSTRPPKNRSGLIAVLLVAVIFLGGIVSALSLLNIRLFRQIQEENPEDSASFRFSAEEATQPEATGTADPSVPGNADRDVELKLNQTPQAISNIPQAGGLSLQDIYAKAIPSVVSVSCSGQTGSSTGTGVVLSSAGYIVTNSHVVQDAQTIRVIFNDGSTQNASLLGMDTVSDLAVLYVDAPDLVAAEFGDSSTARVGDAVVAIGDPLGIELRGTMTDGIISAINRNINTGGRTMTLIQTNAALNSGNSGGPLLNCYGQVIGINTMKIGDYMSDAGVEGLGFAIPSTTVKEIVDQLISNGYVSGRPTLGITGQAVTTFDQLYYRIPLGVYITAVSDGSSAAQLGIAPGDILLTFDGVRVTDVDTLENLLYAHDAGDTVSVLLYRAGNQYSLELTLDEAQ